MSIAICWRQKSRKPNRFDSGTSTSYERLIIVFGTVITARDIPRLNAMSVASNDKFYAEVADIIAEFGDIEVWGEH